MDINKRFKSHNLTVLKTVGKGTYGNVYLCKRKDNTLTIVKEIELNIKFQDHEQDIINEINILSCLNHVNIIKFYSYYNTDNHVMISMEYASSGNLAEYMYKRSPKLLQQQEILFYYCQVLLGVDYIHSKNIIHRDLKAENILLTGKCGVVVKIGDFGISKMLARPQVARSSLRKECGWTHTPQEKADLFAHTSTVLTPNQVGDTNTETEVEAVPAQPLQISLPPFPVSEKELCKIIQGLKVKKASGYDLITMEILKELPRKAAKKTSTVIGTPYYLAPELCEGKPYDNKSDVWALGCLLYEMCTHKRAFEAETLVGLVKAITSGSVHPLDLTTYDRSMQDLVDSMLSILPDKRPTVKELMGRRVLLPTIYTIFLDAGNEDLLYLKVKEFN
ncbi:unnamed protein product [Arctia plantaginis]|uniref:non-specific serine/threonine protein kinase n=1 Tax=Arctia plantaginis TaxID=874455 RepID=A0A8S1AD37_ARCPL|nr:unnamed protein product [Arctia plantaginis]